MLKQLCSAPGIGCALVYNTMCTGAWKVISQFLGENTTSKVASTSCTLFYMPPLLRVPACYCDSDSSASAPSLLLILTLAVTLTKQPTDSPCSYAHINSHYAQPFSTAILNSHYQQPLSTAISTKVLCQIHFVNDQQAAAMYEQLGVDPQIVANWEQMPVPGWPQ